MNRARTRSIAASALILIAALAAWWTFTSGRNQQEVQYNGKSLSEWFFSQRRDFYSESTRQKADDAFKAVGTNGFAFLISILNERGNSSFHFNLYRKMPPPIQRLLQHPLSTDDIQMMALRHIRNTPNIPNTIPEELLARLARRVPDLSNPQVRIAGLYALHQLTRYEREPLLRLSRQLLDDPHFGIRLETALNMAELGIKEPRMIPILFAALEDKEKRASARPIKSYAFGQLPGGSGTGGIRAFSGQTIAEIEKTERKRLVSALELFGPELNEHQQSLLRQFKIANQLR